MWKTSPTNKILYCKGLTLFTVIAVRTMAGSYVQLTILMRNFGKFQSGMLVLIIWQRHIAICFSLGPRFHCLHSISNTCILLGKYRSYIWLNKLLINSLTE